MKRTIELLAPGGDIECIKAAIMAGADAVYCGLDKFNARNRAANISFDDLNGILRLAHRHNCQVFLTLNIIIVESELAALFALLNKLVNTSIDGIIVQDLGLFYLLSTYFEGLAIHASTQLTTHNEGQIKFLQKLKATRVNLCRELNINEIKQLSAEAHKNDVLVEVFVHGSNCICFSGICYISSVHGGNSGNRGRCSQPCRDEYVTTATGKSFPLNLKDNSAFTDLEALYEAGVDSLKIEGRIKKFHYVYTVVDAWRKQLNGFAANHSVNTDTSALYKVFNRSFTNAFLRGDINKDMFIDNPRDNSAIHLSGLNGSVTDETLEKAKGDIYDERTEIITSVETKLKQISIAKAPLHIYVSGESGQPLTVTVVTSDATFTVSSESKLSTVGTQALTYHLISTRLKALNDTEYYIEELDLDKLSPNVFIPFKDLTAVKKQLLFWLNGSREMVEPVAVPVLPRQTDKCIKPSLSVLISSATDLYLAKDSSATVYYQLPASFKNEYWEYVDLFAKNSALIPWFPSVIIGEDYRVAVDFLQKVQPRKIVTNNTGIAYEAYKMGIAWIAGPYMNCVNSFSLICLKENFNCAGAFISNELNKIQLKGIKKPADFELYYSIYHPIVLMTSRQCLLHQVTGCVKDKMDELCIDQCSKTATIINLKKELFVIEKSKGNYHCIYNEVNFLNTDIVTDMPNVFGSFFIDLREVKTETKIEVDKLSTVTHFENLLNGNVESREELKQLIYPSTYIQYKKGI